MLPPSGGDDMRGLPPLCFALLLLAPACGAGGDGAPDAGVDAYTAPEPSEDWTRDILHTSLRVDVTTLDATAVIRLAPSATTGASFEVGDLDLRAVYDAHGPLQHRRGGAQLDLGIAAGESPVDVTIEYTYRYHTGFQGASMSGYTLTWPYYCGNLFPCKSDPADGMTFDLEVTGVTGDGYTAVYPASIPTEAPSYMLAWTVGEYSRIDLGATEAGTQVAVWHFPGRADKATAGTEHLVEAVDWLEQTYGDYPFGDTLGVVEVGWGAGMYGGMEHHPIWHVSMDALSNDETNVHEAVHGWFGNGVRIRCWEDFVLSEGPADYLAARALTAVAGALVGSQIWSDLEARLDALQASGDNKVAWPASCGEVDILADGLFGEAPYVKGALFLRAVERRVGVAAFDAALAAFLAAHLGQAAGMQDLLDTIEAETGYDPTACADAWLRSEEAPADFTCPAE
jgi:hypothetical protein